MKIPLAWAKLIWGDPLPPKSPIEYWADQLPNFTGERLDDGTDPDLNEAWAEVELHIDEAEK